MRDELAFRNNVSGMERFLSRFLTAREIRLLQRSQEPCLADSKAVDIAQISTLFSYVSACEWKKGWWSKRSAAS